MMEELLKAIPIVLLTMFKFVFGPTLGYAAGFSFFKTVLITIIGSMLSVILFSYFGEFLRENVIRKYFPPRKKFTKRSRQSINLWRKYGLIGAAVLMPVLLTPIGGTLLAIGFGEKKERVILFMFLSAVAWALIISYIVYFMAELIF
jgi:membrane protein DedA with SNARE-associated domain